jgi:hypothetical protein
MPPPPAPLTRRLLAALETHAREDAGPVALGDWPALSQLFDRELSLLSRLAAAAEIEGAAKDPELKRRAGILRARYDGRAKTLQQATAALAEERDQIDATRRRGRDIGRAYAQR